MAIDNKNIEEIDIELILNSLNHYESQTSITNTELSTLTDDDRYKLSTELDENFEHYDSFYYLFNACKNGNETAVKVLLKHVADMTIKDKDNRIALTWACESGNLHLVKYLVHIGGYK